MLKGNITTSLIITTLFLLVYSQESLSKESLNNESLNKTTKDNHSQNRCSPIWQVKDRNGQCKPKYYFQTCDAGNRCSSELGDNFKLVTSSPSCEGGERTIIEIPTTYYQSGSDTYDRIMIDVYACAPITRFPPDNAIN